MSSKRHVRRHMCGDKHRHANEQEALAHLHMLARSGKKRGGLMTVYKCKFCHLWHIGHRKVI